MKKINIAELLRNCPTGMELDCTMFENVTFEEVVTEIDCDGNEEIKIVLLTHYKDGMVDEIILTEFGTYTHDATAKCVIFPKGKTTWEGFQKPWTIQDAKDGDVVSYGDGWTCIFKCIHGIWFSSYCFITSDGEFHTGYEEHEVHTTINGNIHLATKEQCNLLFQKIKEAGYKWNLETKTLEKFIESKEDKTVMAGIYFDREYYADEVELHLNNYEIENRDGKTYAVIKNQETKISKSKFKDGDVIVDKYGAVAIYKRVHSSYEEPYVDFYCGISSTFRSLYIKDSDSLQHCGRIDTLRLATEEEKQELFQAIKEKGYRWDAETKTLEKLIEPYFKVGDKIRSKNDKTIIKTINYIYHDSYALYDNHLLYFKEQDEWELVPNKFDINTLKPFDSRVLVRDDNCYEWEADIFGRYSNGYITLGGGKWNQCIPYEGNEHLFGTTNDCDDFYKTWENEKDDNSIQCD